MRETLGYLAGLAIMVTVCFSAWWLIMSFILMSWDVTIWFIGQRAVTVTGAFLTWVFWMWRNDR